MVCGLPDTAVEEAYLMLSSSLYGGRCTLSVGESPPHHGFARSAQEIRETFTACMQDSCTILQIIIVKPGYKHIGHKHILTNKHAALGPKRVLVRAKHKP
jgi:hypothetical protein